MESSFYRHDTRLFVFHRNIRLADKLLPGWGQDELDECLNQRMRLLLGQEKHGAPERIAAVFDGGALRFNLVDRQESDRDAA
jgi:hypothetical protein